MKIGIDLGTTNTKALALNAAGEVVYECSHPTTVISVPTGGEMDAKQLGTEFLHLLQNTISEIRKITDEPLEGIGLTGMAEAGCLVNDEFEPITPILLWYDRRGAEEAEELRAEYEDALTSVSGIRMSNVATIYKLANLKKWYTENRPGCTKKWVGVPEWAAWLLTAEHYTDRTLAVRTGAYSLKTNDWSPGICGIVGIDPDIFPQVIPARQQNILISPEIAAWLGVPETVRVTVAGHDDMAAAFGAGLSDHVWVDSTGTAEGLVALTASLPDARQTVKNRMSIAPWYDEGQWALIAGVGTSGSLLAELRKQTGLEFSQIDEMAKLKAPHPENAIATELTPARIAKVSFLPGLSNEQKVSAVYDLILSNFIQRAGQIMKFAPSPERLVITGGHALLPELSRRKSEALGSIPTEARPKPEAAAYGAARLCGNLTPDSYSSNSPSNTCVVAPVR